MKPKAIAGWLALAALAVVVFAPPEAYGSGRMLLVIAATFAFVIAAAEGEISRGYLRAGLVGGILLLAHALVFSLDWHRSLEFLGLVWAYYCLFGFFRFSGEDHRHRVATSLVLLATAVSLYGLHQYFWGFDRMTEFVTGASGAETTRTGLLSLLASERVFATFVLPGTLWGFLLLTLPLHAALHSPDRPYRNLALLANAGLVVVAAALTQSFGFVVGLLAVALGWLFTRPDGGRSLQRAVAAAVLAAPVAGAIYAVRAGTHNPILLRLQNWLTAWEIFAAHPWGAGLNTYAVLYMPHQQPGANETQFAHNTPLQLLSELGVFALIPAAAAVAWMASNRHLLRTEGVRRCLLVALIVWSVHNLIDINVYFGSVGAVGAALAGLFFRRPLQPDARRMEIKPSRWLAPVGVLAFLAVASTAVIYIAGELYFRARTEVESLKVEAAAETLRLAAWINPFDSSIHHEAGQVALELYHKQAGAAWLDQARYHFSRAIELSPYKVGPHIGLALTYSSVDETETALARLAVAQALHPSGAQATTIRRLVERRQATLARAAVQETTP